MTYSKRWDDTGASIVVDFPNERIEYPVDKGFKVNIATTCNFSDNENFVVLACITKLFDKGYRPESIELERLWSLGHEQKGGKADICVDDEHGNTLVIVECKTPGKEFRDEWRAMQDDGGQLFSYWQQERATRWLVLFTCDIHDGAIDIEQISISCTDDENYRVLAKSDDSVRLYAGAHTVEQLHDVWLETYNKTSELDVLFGKRSTAYNPLVPPLLKGDLVDFKAEDRIVNQFEEILRHNNVSDKENAFNRLIALFIAKLQDEMSKLSTQEVEFQYKQGQDTYESLQDRLQRLHSEGMKKLMREEVFYVSSNEAEGIVSRYTGQNRKRLIETLNETFRKLKFYTNSDFAFKDVHNEQLFLQNGKVLVEVVKLFQPYRIVQPGGTNPEDGQFLGDLFEQLLNHGYDNACDFVDAVFSKANLDGWQDADDFCAYLDKIQCDGARYSEFVGRSKPWREWEGIPHFSAYHEAFSKSSALRNIRKTRAYKAASQEGKQLDEDLAFYRYAHAEERERLRVFALVHGERTLIVNSPTQTSEVAAFLGYKWSNRKGNEGIQILDGGGLLYSDDPMSDELKLSDVIRMWFSGESPDAGDLSQFYYYADTQDFIDFDGEKFDKSLRMPRTYYKPRIFAPDVEVARLGDVAGYVTKTAGKFSIALDSYVTTENMVKGRLGVAPYEGDAPASAGTAYELGDTLVSNIRPYLQKIWMADRDGACSKDVLVFRSKDTGRMLPEFLHVLLWQSDFFDYDMSTFTGTGRPRGDKDALLGYRVPLPSIEEQNGIVQLFQALTGSITEKNLALAAIEEDARTRFVELFGDPADNLRGWKTAGLMELGTFRNGLNYSSSERGVQISCLGVSDFKNRSAIEDTGELGAISLNALPSDECFLKDGDIVFVRSNGNKELVGRCLVVYPHDEKVVYSGFCIRLRLTSKQVLAPYIVSALRQPSMRSKMFGKGSNIQNLNQEMLAAISVPVPPMDLQAEFSEFLSSSSRKQSELYRQIESLGKERDSLLDRFIVK